MKEAVQKIKEFSSEEWIQDGTSRDRLIESQHKTAMENAIRETEIITKLEKSKAIARKCL